MWCLNAQKDIFQAIQDSHKENKVLLRKGLKIYEKKFSSSHWLIFKFRDLNLKPPLFDVAHSTEAFCSDHRHPSDLPVSSADVPRVPSDDWKDYLYFLLKTNSLATGRKMEHSAFVFYLAGNKAIPANESWECSHVIFAFGLGMLKHNVLRKEFDPLYYGEKIQSNLLKQDILQPLPVLLHLPLAAIRSPGECKTSYCCTSYSSPCIESRSSCMTSIYRELSMEGWQDPSSIPLFTFHLYKSAGFVQSGASEWLWGKRELKSDPCPLYIRSAQSPSQPDVSPLPCTTKGWGATAGAELSQTKESLQRSSVLPGWTSTSPVRWHGFQPAQACGRASSPPQQKAACGTGSCTCRNTPSFPHTLS